MKTHYENFVRSPLPGAATSAVADSIDSVFRNEQVQGAAEICSAKQLRLAELAGAQAEISAAIQKVGRSASLTADSVVEALQQHAQALDAAIAACQADHVAHRTASTARMARHKALRLAVGARLTSLVAEREHIVGVSDAARRAASMPGSANRFAILRSAGLTDAQISILDPDAASPEALVQRRHDRIAEIDSQIDRLRAFSASPTFDSAMLEGFPEFAELVAERDGQKVPA